MAAIFLYIFMVAGFIGAGWCTDAIFGMFKKREEPRPFDSLLVIAVWGGLFGSFGYLIASWLH